MDYRETMKLAVDAIMGGGLSTGEYTLDNGAKIRAVSPDPGTVWGLLCQVDGIDFLVREAPGGVYYISVGKPNTHWLKCAYYCIYE